MTLLESGTRLSTRQPRTARRHLPQGLWGTTAPGTGTQLLTFVLPASTRVRCRALQPQARQPWCPRKALETLSSHRRSPVCTPSLCHLLLTPSLGKHIQLADCRSGTRATRKAKDVTICHFLLLYERCLCLLPRRVRETPTCRKEDKKMDSRRKTATPITPLASQPEHHPHSTRVLLNAPVPHSFLWYNKDSLLF